MSLSVNSEKPRKRQYRQRITCETCKKEIDSDYKDNHVKKMHKGEKVKFSVVVDAHQSQLSHFFASSTKPPKRSMKAKESSDSSESVSSSEYSSADNTSNRFPHPLDKDVAPNQSPSTSVVPSITPSQPLTVASNEQDQRKDVIASGFSNKSCNPQDTTDDSTSTQPTITPFNVQDSRANITPTQSSTIHFNTQDVIDCFSSTEPDSTMDEGIMEIFTIKHWAETTSTTKDSGKISCESQFTSTSSNTEDPINQSSTSSLNLREDFNLTQSSNPSWRPCSAPNQPILKEYNRKKFGNETSRRDFNPYQWYKTYPWIHFDIENRQCVCFACREFMRDNTFTFDNWKKSDRLKKHTQSSVHKDAMAKWICSKMNANRQTSVMKQLTEAHQQDVQRNREYLRVIITSIFYNAQQNVAFRGHDENRKDIGEMSDVNRGNLLELLHLRCDDIPWLEAKLQSQLKLHAQWTSASIQNEILEIISSFVVEQINQDVLLSQNYSLIMDETSDISRVEQVSICLRYVLAGKILETFIGFFSTESTEGEVLFELVKRVITNRGLKLEDIVGECFDGASNMSGARKGVAARMKECSPRGVYVHCYAHVLNLALKDAMSEVEPLRNALGVLQSLYNFLEASPKRHAVFNAVKVDADNLVLTLKSLSETRWSCRWEAVRAVAEQMSKIVNALLTLAKDKDTKTYTDSGALLNAICDFEFVFGLVLLKVILSNTNSLNKYLQGKSIDVIAAKRNADLTIKTLRKCRNEKNFELLWKRATLMSDEIKRHITGSRFVFKEARASRSKPSRRLQALVGESSENTVGVTTPESDHRINTFYRSLDKVLGEMKSRFDSNDQEILCALGDVVLNDSPLETSFETVAEFYNVDKDRFEVEKNMYHIIPLRTRTNLAPELQQMSSTRCFRMD